MGSTYTDKDHIIAPERYVFWMNDLTVLFRDQQYIKFVPTKDMTRVEQLNAMTRFCIYLFLIFVLFERTDEWLALPIVGLILIIVLYNIYHVDEDGKREELLRMKRKNELADFEPPELNYRTFQVIDDGEVKTIDIDEIEEEQFKDDLDEKLNKPTDYELEAGLYDANNKLIYGKEYNATTGLTDKDDKIKFTLEEKRIYDKSTCRKPTVNNPFMNPSVDDFNKENIPVACNSDDEDIHNDMTVKFNADLYRDVDDVFNKKNSQRQFFTVHHNIPNDQEAFARWCYKFPSTCKTNQTRCLRWEDLRFKY